MVGDGCLTELTQRAGWYYRDWIDGVVGGGTLSKTLSTIFLLYFICLLPTIAFGALNESNTNGFFTVEKAIIAQGFGGVAFALFSAQPLVVLLSTAPLALIIKVTFQLAASNDIPFQSLYAWVGIFNSLFLILFSLTNLSAVFIRHSSLFLEETFAVFISLAFTVDAFTALAHEFEANYSGERRDSPLLWIILMFGTVLIGQWFWGFRKSVLLSATARTLIVDFALPAAVIMMALIGALAFQSVEMDTFNAKSSFSFDFPDLKIQARAIGLALPLGFTLSLLFFMDQNVSAALVQTPVNKLKKGVYYHFDLAVVALINLILSLLGLPWIHGALPHSPMHARALADFELKVDVQTGYVYTQVLHARETRLPSMIAYMLIALSLLLLPNPLQHLPLPVLYGLFLYMAATSLNGNGFWGRIQLLFTEKSNYPSTTVVRMVSRGLIRKYTLVQLASLTVLCLNGFYPNPYVQMTFPLMLVLLIAFRRRVLTKYFGQSLRFLDGHDTQSSTPTTTGQYELVPPTVGENDTAQLSPTPLSSEIPSAYV